MLACALAVLLSICSLPLMPMYVDTGVNAIYARKTTISTRINSLILARKTLPTVPSNVTGRPLEPEVSKLIGGRSSHGTSSHGSTKSVFKREVRG